MLRSFSGRQPHGMEQARMLAAEMARVATLWEEQWVATLQDAQVRAHGRCLPHLLFGHCREPAATHALRAAGSWLHVGSVDETRQA